MKLIQQTVEYLHAVRSEVKKVSWPSKRDTLRYASLVIGIGVATGLFFALSDYGFNQLFEATIYKWAKPAQEIQLDNVKELPLTPGAVQTEPTAPTTPDTGTIDLNDAKPIETPTNQ
ncbi:MAG: preprotein translocase subunit SecE [Patescibacteria group bacterium]|nr:preprotein translocase subunit SecE [Patescibacteria group bacterium]